MTFCSNFAHVAAAGWCIPRVAKCPRIKNRNKRAFPSRLCQSPHNPANVMRLFLESQFANADLIRYLQLQYCTHQLCLSTVFIESDSDIFYKFLQGGILDETILRKKIEA
jgi:hypothetical protein